MSYILDALKRADAERQQGATPGLHLLQEPVLLGKLPDDPLKSRLTWPIVLGAVVIALGLGAGFWRWTGPGVDQLASADSALPAFSPSVITPHIVRPVSAPAGLPGPAKPQPKVVPKSNAEFEPSVMSQPLLQPAQVPVSVPGAGIPFPVKVQGKASEAVGTLETASPATAAEIPRLNDLPDAIRRQLPKLQVTGSIYSDNPSQRLLLISGQVLEQGSNMTPELKLEEIGESSSVFNFGGKRFRVPH